MKDTQQELLKELSSKSSLNEIQSYIKKVMEVRGFNKEKSSDKILLLVEEVGELAKAIRKNESKLGIDKTKEYNYSSVEFPKLDLQQAPLGIFGKAVKDETVLRDGDRIEVYRP